MELVNNLSSGFNIYFFKKSVSPGIKSPENAAIAFISNGFISGFSVNKILQLNTKAPPMIKGLNRMIIALINKTTPNKKSMSSTGFCLLNAEMIAMAIHAT